MPTIVNILIADDDPQIRRLLLRVVSSMAHQCAAVEGVSQLKEVCRGSGPDMLITDVTMPDGDGITTAKELMRQYPALRVIVMSGDPQHGRRALNEGFTRVLQKPFTIDQFNSVFKDAAG